MGQPSPFSVQTQISPQQGMMPGPPMTQVSGVIAQHAGFVACFGLAAVLSVAYLPLLWAAERRRGSIISAP